MFFRQEKKERKVEEDKNPRGTNSSFKGKDINKFVFNFESDQSEDSSQEKNVDMTSSCSKLQRLKSFKHSSKIMPSIMQTSKHEQIDYDFEQSKVNYPRRKVKSTRMFVTMPLFDDDQQIQAENVEQKYEEFKTKSQISVVSLNPEIDKIEQNNEERGRDKKYKYNDVANIFEDDSAISIFANSQMQLNQQSTIKAQVQPSIQFEFNDQQNELQEYVESQNQNQVTIPTCGDEIQNLQQLVYPSQESKELSHTISKKLGGFEDLHNIRIFLSTLIPKGVYFNFEIHKYKSFLKTEYLFWLEHGDQMTLYATAINDKVYVEKNVFRLNMSRRSKNRKKENEDIFIGDFVSDFKRQTYSLYDHKNYLNPRQNNNVLCTVSTITNFVQPKIKSQQLYVPKSQNNRAGLIANTSLSKNLKKLKKLKEFGEKVDKYTTHGVPSKILSKMKEQFKITTNTSRNVILKNKQQEVKMLFFKMQQNRFKIRVGSGLSPIQVFAYAIVHLQA